MTFKVNVSCLEDMKGHTAPDEEWAVYETQWDERKCICAKRGVHRIESSSQADGTYRLIGYLDLDTGEVTSGGCKCTFCQKREPNKG
jgi:hypothetical protein